MKVNVFIKKDQGSKLAVGVRGEDIWSNPEDDIIEQIDQEHFSEKKIQAQAFLKFLSNRRLTIEKLKQLSSDEQLRLKNEFLSN